MLFAYFSDGQQVGREWWTRRSLQLSHQSPRRLSRIDSRPAPVPGPRCVHMVSSCLMAIFRM